MNFADLQSRLAVSIIKNGIGKNYTKLRKIQIFDLLIENINKIWEPKNEAIPLEDLKAETLHAV